MGIQNTPFFFFFLLTTRRPVCRFSGYTSGVSTLTTLIEDLWDGLFGFLNSWLYGFIQFNCIYWLWVLGYLDIQVFMYPGYGYIYIYVDGSKLEITFTTQISYHICSKTSTSFLHFFSVICFSWEFSSLLSHQVTNQPTNQPTAHPLHESPGNKWGWVSSVSSGRRGVLGRQNTPHHDTTRHTTHKNPISHFPGKIPPHLNNLLSDSDEGEGRGGKHKSALNTFHSTSLTPYPTLRLVWIDDWWFDQRDEWVSETYLTYPFLPYFFLVYISCAAYSPLRIVLLLSQTLTPSLPSCRLASLPLLNGLYVYHYMMMSSTRLTRWHMPLVRFV